jgi:hypothetical protein
VLLSAAVLFLGSCGTGAQPSPPTGVDELVIPTPSPDPHDFVARIDNPWLPLAPGRTWVYDVHRAGRPAAVRTVRVLPDPVVVDRVTTTAVRDVLVRPGEPRAVRTDFYAQDRAGNVWWFGQDGFWRAGEEGAEAGLVMAAHPRLGDGYRSGYAPGRLDEVVTVARVRPEVMVERTSVMAPDAATWDTYRRGVGLVDRLVTDLAERDLLRTR